MAISPDLLNDGESVVIDTRTHVKALLLPLLALVVILAVASLASRTTSSFGSGSDVVSGLILVGAGVAIIGLVVVPFLEWYVANYTITDRRLITRSGILTRRGHDIPLARISDVAYEHGVIDRLLGCGTLVVSDASTRGSVKLPDIPRVEETHRQIVKLLHDLHQRHDGT